MRFSLACSAFFLFFFASCSAPQGPLMPAFTDPAYREVAFRSIAVYADTNALAWRKDFESNVAADLNELHVAAGQASWFVSPTREWDRKDVYKALTAAAFDACLEVRVLRSEMSERFIPEEKITTIDRVPVTEKFRVKVNGRWVEKDSVTGYRDVRRTTTEGGYTQTREQRTFRLTLMDLASGRTAWTGEYAAFMDVFSVRALSRVLSRQLVWDKIVRVQEKS